MVLNNFDTDDTYHWFQESQAWKRIEFICNIIRFCNPFELRFIASYIEDTARLDYNALKEQETKANSIQSLEEFIQKNPSSDEFRSHVSVGIALLHSRNYNVAARVGDLLEGHLKGVTFQHLNEAHFEIEIEQWMLVLILASNHPAFRFEMKLVFMQRLKEYEEMQKRNRTSWNCHNPPNQDLEDTEYKTGVNPATVPYERYSSPNCSGYVQYNNAPYLPHMQGQLGKGYPMQMNSSFSTTVVSPTYIGDSHMDGYYPMSSSDYPLVFPHCRTQELAKFSSYVPPHSVTAGSRTKLQEQFPSSTSIAGVDDDTKHSISSVQSTVSQPKTFANVTSVLSTVVTTSVANSGITYNKSAIEQFRSKVAAKASNPSDSNSAFVTIPTSGNARTLSNKACYQISMGDKLTNRNRSHSGDTTIECRDKAQTVTHFSAAPLRSSTSAPLLATSAAHFNGMVSKKGSAGNNKNGSTSTVAARIKQSPRPATVWVKLKGRGSSIFRFQIMWTDGTSSECEHTVQNIIYFYKQVNAKLGRNSANIDSFADPNNLTMEQSHKLQNIFKNFLTNSVSDSNISEVLRFFKHNMPPPMSQPRKKYRQASKARQAVDGSSSSSSTASPPLANNTKRQILQSSESTLRASTSPPPARSVTSTSSVRSSPSSIASVPTSTEEPADVGLDDRNDEYLKLFYWLKSHNLTEVYKHLTKYTFDEFCKLQQSDIDAIPRLSNGHRRKLKRAKSKMFNEKTGGTLDIHMGALSISSKNSNSDTSSDNGKTDIKSIVGDDARQSEDDKSSSGQSAPVSFTNCSYPDTVASDVPLSFEFEGTDKDCETSLDAQTNEFRCTKTSPPYRTVVVDPSHGSGLGDIYFPNNLSSRPHYLPPVPPNMDHSSESHSVSQPVTYSWLPSMYGASYIPSSNRFVPNTYVPNIGGVSRTTPSPVHSHYSRPMHYNMYNATTTVPQPTSDDRNVTNSEIEAAVSHPENVGCVRPQNLDVGDNKTYVNFNDPDSSLKFHNGPNITDSNKSDVTSTLPSNYRHAWPPPTFVPLHPRHPPPMAQGAFPLTPSYSDHTVYRPRSHQSYHKHGPKPQNNSMSSNTHVMNGYPESGPASYMARQDSNRSRYKRHYSGDGPRKKGGVQCSNCGRKGHHVSACRDIADSRGTDFQLNISPSGEHGTSTDYNLPKYS